MLNELELSSEMFPRAREVVAQGLSQGVAPGIAAALWDMSRPEVYFSFGGGNRQEFPEKLPLSTHTLFDVASLTKVIATAALAGVLVQRRWLSWENRVADFFPDYEFKEIRLKHLFSHTAGFIDWLPFWENLRDQFARKPLHKVSVEHRQRYARELVLAAKPQCGPGERCLYSDISMLLAGFVLEEILGLPLDVAVRRYVWNPMGMTKTFFKRVTESVQAGRMSEVAATEKCPWRGAVLQGQVHDDNCWAMGGYAGHAGAFSTLGDLVIFSRHVFGSFFSREVLHDFSTPVAKPAACTRTMGWDMPSPTGSMLGTRFSPRSIGHWGFTGTSLWLDLDAGVSVVLLTNRVHPSRNNDKIRSFRPAFHDAIREDWAKLGQ